MYNFESDAISIREGRVSVSFARISLIEEREIRDGRGVPSRASASHSTVEGIPIHKSVIVFDEVSIEWYRTVSYYPTPLSLLSPRITEPISSES